jgi:hypothetical protein
VQLKTNSRELNEAINAIVSGADIGKVEDALRPQLAQAFNALARLVKTSGHDVTLLADISADAATLSLVTGKASEALTPDTPWENPHWTVIDQERQAGQAAADKAEAGRIRELLNNSA